MSSEKIAVKIGERYKYNRISIIEIIRFNKPEFNFPLTVKYLNDPYNKSEMSNWTTDVGRWELLKNQNKV
jgi:hypothetical protein